jgi:tetratricopeptide (TPR) repeat protein
MGVLIAAVFMATGAFAQTGYGAWQEAKTFYDAGKYEDAFRSLRSNPTENAAYYYNLGTIAYKLGRPGTAVAFLEKAAELQPGDSATSHNLQLSRAALTHLIGQDRLDPATTWYESLADRAATPEAKGAIGLVGLIVALGWFRAFRRVRSLGPTLLEPAGMLGALGLAATVGVFGAGRLAELHPPAICVERQVVRSGPGEHFLEIGSVEAGSRIRLLGPAATVNASADASTAAPPSQGTSLDGERDKAVAQTPNADAVQTWRQVRFSQEAIGWVRSSSLLLL